MSPPPGGDVARSRLHPRAPLARALRWLIPLRYPVALGATLLTLPAVADAPAARLFLGNLFVLGTPELAVVGLLTPLAAWTAVRTARLVPGLRVSTLGTTEDTDSYIELMRANTRLIVDNLR